MTCPRSVMQQQCKGREQCIVCYALNMMMTAGNLGKIVVDAQMSYAQFQKARDAIVRLSNEQKGLMSYIKQAFTDSIDPEWLTELEKMLGKQPLGPFLAT